MTLLSAGLSLLARAQEQEQRQAAMENTWTTNGQGFWNYTQTDDAGKATVRVDPARRMQHPISPLLFGKFCEHLGRNIYGGMEAQILENPTFGRWLFSVGEDQKFGGYQPEHDAGKIRESMRGLIRWWRLPDVDRYIEAFEDGGAAGWMRQGARDKVKLSPDVGPRGGRAQRFETSAAGEGLAQWMYLPLHRTRSYEYRLIGRSPEATQVQLSIEDQVGRSLWHQQVAFSDEWSTHTGSLRLPEGLDSAAVYRLTITTIGKANIVLARALLYPADHIGHADPEIIAMLKEAHLPLLRWPGGNFVSGWDWHDSIGPVDDRPTRANPGWGGLEYNLFGTDEYIAFCRAVGCMPMICVNAGSDTPESAAEWIEYCNGAPTSRMGAMRAANGHAEPYNVRYWEIGNELWGHWQVGWTTPEGMADRHRRFAKAMLAADPSIVLLGCGRPEWTANAWDEALFRQTAGTFRINTDHILCGGAVTPKDSQLDIFHAYAGQAYAIGEEYARMRSTMSAAGIKDGQVAITELQVFPWYRADGDNKAGGLKPDDIPRPDTITEALYAMTMINEAIRLDGFVELITHSATVNHGGGLAKSRQHSFAQPVHYAHLLGGSLMNCLPASVDLQCASFATSRAFERIPKLDHIPVLDAMAGVSADGKQLVLILINRSGNAPVTVDLQLGTRAQQCQVTLLSADSPTARNTSNAPDTVTPHTTGLALSEGKCELDLAPCCVARVVADLP